MNKKEIKRQYNELTKYYDKYLKKHGVKIPNLKRGGDFTIGALVLVYLYENMNKKISKSELTAALRDQGYEINDLQQARHLGQQYGWYIISGTRNDEDCKKYNVNPGEYMLLSVKEPYPSFKVMKRNESLDVNSFKELKERYNYRCATCGSKEGEKNIMYPASITKLQQGHKNPGKPLDISNVIPQCDFCNRASRNFFVFDNKGRVSKIYDPNFILKSEAQVKQVMLKLLIEEDLNLAKKIINSMDTTEDK